MLILKHKNTLLLYNTRITGHKHTVRTTNEKVLLDKLNKLVIDETQREKKKIVIPDNKNVERYQKQQDAHTTSKDILNDIVGKMDTEGSGFVKQTRKKKYIQI
jgi:hypothetical protein